MRCGRCRRTLRYDEVNHLADFRVGENPGYHQCCPTCCAEAEGLPPPEPRRYPVGEPVPRHPQSDADLPICGLCRIALLWGEQPKCVRLTDADGLALGVEPGVYPVGVCCRKVLKDRARKGEGQVEFMPL